MFFAPPGTGRGIFRISHWCGSTRSLPPWGRRLSEARSDEVPAVQIRRRAALEGTACCTSPGPRGATLPKGEGQRVKKLKISDRRGRRPRRPGGKTLRFLMVFGEFATFAWGPSGTPAPTNRFIDSLTLPKGEGIDYFFWASIFSASSVRYIHRSVFCSSRASRSVSSSWSCWSLTKSAPAAS